MPEDSSLQLTPAYQVWKARLDAGEAWGTLSDAERCDIILTQYPGAQWFEEPALSTLAIFRADPIAWGRIKAHAPQAGVSAYDLEKAVDSLPRHHTNGHAAYNPLTGWDGLSTAERLERIVVSRDPQFWYGPASLATLAEARHQPAVWGYVKAAAVRAHIFPPDLEKAVDALLALQRPDRQPREHAATPVDSASLEQRSTASVLGMLSESWRIPIAEVIRHGTEGGTIHLILDTGQDVALGTSETVLNEPKKVRGAIYAATGVVVPRYGAKEADAWDEIAGMLAAVAVLVETPELNRLGQIKALLRDYLQNENCEMGRDASSEEWETLAYRNAPFVRGELVHIHAQTLWLRHTKIMAPDLSQAAILDMLRLVGAHRITIALHEFHTSRSVWAFPPALLGD